MDIDLTLRLGMAGMNSAQVPKNEPKNTHQRFGSEGTADMMEVQHNFRPPEEMNPFPTVDIPVSKSKVGGSKKRKSTNTERPPAPKQEDVSRICGNGNCKVRETPMWRKGPHGPKTLCNACGIKYRKMKVKEEQEAGSSGGGSSWYQSACGGVAGRLFYY